jgi:uncharacterized membrane protein YfcA
MQNIDLLIFLGAFAGGFVSGLTGFGTALAAMPIWLYAVQPIVAAPMIVICAIVAQLQTLPAIWHNIDWRRAVPFIIGGLMGVPVGAALLAQVPILWFKILIGFFLIVYCSFMLLKRSLPNVSWGGNRVDMVVGLAGGVLGGLAGLSGVLPTIWVSLKGWSKHVKRSLFQTYNLTILIFALVSQAVGGFVTIEVGRLLPIALPGTLFGAWLGRKIYNRLGDKHFDQVVLVLLLLSGISIIVTSVL